MQRKGTSVKTEETLMQEITYDSFEIICFTAVYA